MLPDVTCSTYRDHLQTKKKLFPYSLELQANKLHGQDPGRAFGLWACGQSDLAPIGEGRYDPQKFDKGDLPV